MRSQALCVREPIHAYVYLFLSSYVYYPNANLTSYFPPFVDFAPFSGMGSINHVAAWYRVLTIETRVHVSAMGFKPIIRSLSESSASAILVQTLAER